MAAARRRVQSQFILPVMNSTTQGFRISASTGLHKGDRAYQQDQIELLVHPRIPGCALGLVAEGSCTDFPIATGGTLGPDVKYYLVAKDGDGVEIAWTAFLSNFIVAWMPFMLWVSESIFTSTLKLLPTENVAPGEVRLRMAALAPLWK